MRISYHQSQHIKMCKGRIAPFLFLSVKPLLLDAKDFH